MSGWTNYRPSASGGGSAGRGKKLFYGQYLEIAFQGEQAIEKFPALFCCDVELPGNIVVGLLLGTAGDSELSKPNAAVPNNHKIMPAARLDLRLKLLRNLPRIILGEHVWFS